MESPLSQEYIHMLEEDSRGQTEVLDQSRPGQVRSARPVQDLPTRDLQLRKVITPSSELRFGCSWTLWKSHRVKILSMFLWGTLGDHNILNYGFCTKHSVCLVVSMCIAGI